MVVASLMLLLAAGCSDGKADEGAVLKPVPRATGSMPGPPADGELPRGGRQIFPKYQLV
ncbi:MAG: hypothetical protein QOH03_1870, partial [Kribbellaceae bacterium]|nr:hypothetical protein [Kribbellaceae bacterium]